MVQHNPQYARVTTEEEKLTFMLQYDGSWVAFLEENPNLGLVRLSMEDLISLGAIFFFMEIPLYDGFTH